MKVTLYAVGDTSPIHEPIGPYSDLIRDALSAADLRFCAAERPYSERGTPQPGSGAVGKPVPPHMASVFDDCGFDVVSIASNHIMDFGPEAMLDTRDLLRAKGIAAIGVGENLEEASRATFIDRNGLRIAFLSFCSVLKEGCAAEAGKAGVAPMRASTTFQPSSSEPGAPARVLTVPDPTDLANMVGHIAAARREADVVVLSLHWGVAFIPRLVADYQKAVADAAVAAGADVILGHHPHAPRAIGMHAGKACFYSLGNFIITSDFLGGDPARIAAFEREKGIRLDPDYPRLPYGTDAKRSLLAKLVLAKTGIDRISFVPMWIDPKNRPFLLQGSDPRFAENAAFMEWVSEGFPHRFSLDGDEIAVLPV
ncbi:CapA family protein [Hydrogenophaga sp.]|uniref:CapA family protein n=1 Tax=Hydrogenophaga sp. TaxID=1904254 RepID=UPI0027234ABC|nr:CapA family protein [Hydrogenophaga sp.]MDO9439171.1 CapA family protein [Hydrogenophaga sp.]